MYHEMICIKSCRGILKKDSIYPVTGKQTCSCGNTIISFGIKHNIIDANNKCTCGYYLKVTDEYWCDISYFAEIDAQVIEAVEELKESLELVEVV